MVTENGRLQIMALYSEVVYWKHLAFSARKAILAVPLDLGSLA